MPFPTAAFPNFVTAPPGLLGAVWFVFAQSADLKVKLRNMTKFYWTFDSFSLARTRWS